MINDICAAPVVENQLDMFFSLPPLPDIDEYGQPLDSDYADSDLSLPTLLPKLVPVEESPPQRPSKSTSLVVARPKIESKPQPQEDIWEKAMEKGAIMVRVRHQPTIHTH